MTEEKKPRFGAQLTPPSESQKAKILATASQAENGAKLEVTEKAEILDAPVAKKNTIYTHGNLDVRKGFEGVPVNQKLRKEYWSFIEDHIEDGGNKSLVVDYLLGIGLEVLKARLKDGDVDITPRKN